jgi:hypothetical protein
VRALVVAAIVLVPASAWALGNPSCTRESGCSVPACYGALPGGNVAYYVCDCKTTGAAGQQPQANCTAGNDGLAGTSPATAWQTYGKAQSQFGLLNAGDRILFCNGGVFDATGAASNQWVNHNSTVGTPVVVGTYTASWGGGTTRPKILFPTATHAFSLQEGSDVVEQGYVFAGLSVEGLGQPATPCGTSSPFPMDAFFLYNQVNNVTLCDMALLYACVGVENAGGNVVGDQNANLLVQYTYMANNGGDGVLGAGNGQTIDHDYFVNNGFERANLNHQAYFGAVDGASNLAFTNNEMYQGTLVAGQCSGSMFVTHGLITNLDVSGNYGHEDGTSTTTSSCYCLQANPGYTATEQFTNINIHGNLCVNPGGDAINISACHGCSAYNNIVLSNNTNLGRSVVFTDDGTTSGGADWHNQNCTMSYNTAWGIGAQMGIVATGSSMVSVGNFVYHTGTGTQGCFNYDQADAAYSFVNNNGCYGPNATTLNWNATGPLSLGGWQGHGFDGASTSGTDPKFSNPRLSPTFAAAGTDFVPGATSYLLGAGVNLYAPATDFVGSTRPQGSVADIGALELIVATQPALPGGHRPWSMGVWLCVLLACAALLGAASAGRARRLRADDEHQHFIDEAQMASLREMGDDGVSLMLTYLCEDCGEPLFLPRTNNGKKRRT